MQAAGDEARTVIAGYHWFTDWGRDTMISLEGLTLITGRHRRSRLHPADVRPLHPRRPDSEPFPEGQKEGLYHTADATLWFFHALARYLPQRRPHDVAASLAAASDIVEHHLRGTRFGIGVDPADGLCGRARGYQLTWMDAKVGDWVVTPRRGKAVEINALWYNALRLWKLGAENEGGEAARPLRRTGRPGGESFNRRFWYADGRYLYDVVDGPRAMILLAVPTDSELSRSNIPCFVATLGSLSSTLSASACSRPSGLRRSRPAIRIIKPRTTAISSPAMPPIIRARSGPG